MHTQIVSPHTQIEAKYGNCSRKLIIIPVKGKQNMYTGPISNIVGPSIHESGHRVRAC